MEKKAIRKRGIPRKGDIYWYLFKSMISHRYEVREKEWTCSLSDAFKMSSENVYKSREKAIAACEVMTKSSSISSVQ